MSAQQSVTLTGRSGKQFTYYAYPIDTVFTPNPGNYAFARRVSMDEFHILYFGETGDLSERFDYHHALSCVKTWGGDTLLARIGSDNAQTRRDEEADLVSAYSPPCNR